MTHYAVKISYIGWKFSGSQRQPNARTVEGEIMRSLSFIGAAESPGQCDLRSAGRTDKGVSALKNVVSFHTDMPPLNLFPALAAVLQDVMIREYAEVSPDFNPRKANERWYRYHLLDKGHDLETMARCVKLFVGYHDFSMFSKSEEDRNPMRRLNSVSISPQDGFILLDVRGESFLWNMVRRIASALDMVGRGVCREEDIEIALAKSGKMVFPPLPAEALLLMDVEYNTRFIPVNGEGNNEMLKEIEEMKKRLIVIETMSF